MLIYIIKLSVCLAMFWIFYKVLLERESFHHFKRIYLLLSLVFSLLIPLITFTSYIESPATPLSAIFSSDSVIMLSTETPSDISTINYFPHILFGIYVAGVVVFAIQFFRNIIKLWGRISNNQKRNFNGITRVLLHEKVSPHTFFNYIFYNRKQLENDEIPEEVHWHEETHAREKHSLDVLIVELLIVFFWFNPVLYMLRKSIKLNHEFLADSFVIRKGISPSHYQKTLLAFTVSSSRVSFANAINYSLIKKRFIIMKKQSKKSAMFIRYLLTIPMLAILIYSCSERELLVQQVIESRAGSPTADLKTNAQTTIIDIVEEYNKLAKQYNAYPEYDFVTKVKDMIRIRELYDQMTYAQIVKAEPYPKSTTGMTIFIKNDGRLLVDQKEVSKESIESVMKQLTREELSNAFLFVNKDNLSKYVKERAAMNRSMVPPNDIYISVLSDELVNAPKGKLHKYDREKIPESTARIVNYAEENKKLKPYVDELISMFRKYGVHIYN